MSFWKLTKIYRFDNLNEKFLSCLKFSVSSRIFYLHKFPRNFLHKFPANNTVTAGIHVEPRKGIFYASRWDGIHQDIFRNNAKQNTTLCGLFVQDSRLNYLSGCKFLYRIKFSSQCAYCWMWMQNIFSWHLESGWEPRKLRQNTVQTFHSRLNFLSGNEFLLSIKQRWKSVNK